MLQLKRILIKNLLSFEHAGFLLGKYTVIVGPNNSGKTNLLRILSMISKNQDFEYMQINTTQKLDPHKPSEIAFTLNLNETEARMVFQCIFDQDTQANRIAKNMRMLDITIFWDNNQSVVTSPKFTLYRFGNGFTISASQYNTNIAFDIGRIFSHVDSYLDAVEHWRTTKVENLFAYSNEEDPILRYANISSKVKFMENILEGQLFDTTQGRIIEGLPASVRYDSNADTPISRLVRRHKSSSPIDSISLGTVLSMIFKERFTLVGEIHPSYQDLSNSLAMLRKRKLDKYDDLRKTFKKISGGIEVQAEKGNDGIEQILFVEDGKKYGINNSASGYYALTSILYAVLDRTSGLVAIDEPEVHLHPTMCLRLHKMLATMTDQNDMQTIIVTHSPKFVTHDQIRKPCKHGLIRVTRSGSASQVHSDTGNFESVIAPHLFNPEIFFGRGTLMVEGPSDYFVMKAISDHCGGLLGEKDIVLMHCNGKGNLPDFIDIHNRFSILYLAMADSDYDQVQDGVIKLPNDLETELMTMGIENVPSKANDYIYDQVTEFLKKTKTEDWAKSKFWYVLEETIDRIEGKVPV